MHYNVLNMQKPSERLKRKIEKENLWLFILSMLKKGKKSGSELKEAITKKFGLITGNVTTYKVLYLLKKGKYVESKRDGKFVFYKITAKGRAELASARRILKFYISRI